MDEAGHREGSDSWLAMWVGIVNSEGISFGVTLMVNGTLVSGEVVSGRTYFEGLARHVRSTGTGSGVEMFAAALDRAAQEYSARKLRSETESGDDEPYPSYIHLRGARIGSPTGAALPGSDVWWRGRLSSIDAFWVGELQYDA